MKRLFSILISSLLITTFMWAGVPMPPRTRVNNYASELKTVTANGVADENRNVTVQFFVPAETSSYRIFVDKNGRDGFEEDEVVYNYTGDVIAANSTVKTTINLNGFSEGEYQWAVEVTGVRAQLSNPAVARDYENGDNRYRFSKALGVAVDNSYESEYFGYSYVSESYTHALYGYNKPSSGLYRTASTDGVYIFKPSMGTVWNTNAAGTALEKNGAYTGGVSWTQDEQKSHGQDVREHGPYRVAVDEDGYVYVCENRPTSDGGHLVYRMNPRNPKANFKIILTQAYIKALDDKLLSSVNLKEFPHRLQSMTVKTVNGKKTLYTILSFVTTSDDRGNSVYIGDNLMNKGALLCSFTINESGDDVTLTYNNDATPLYDFQCASPNRKLAVVNTYNSVVAGAHGDLWVFQYIASNIVNKYSGVIHFYRDSETGPWKCDKALDVTSEYYNVRGVGALSMDGSLLAVPTIDFSVRFFDVTYQTDGRIKGIREKSWTWPKQRAKASGNATTNEAGIWDEATGGTASVPATNAIDGLAFDVANNLYVIAGDGERSLLNENYTRSRLYVFACPKENKHLTPARSSLTLKVSSSICWHPYPDGVFMTNDDLFAMFRRDYKLRYGVDCDTTKNPNQFLDFMTNPNSPWKWLGDYIIDKKSKRGKTSVPEDMDTNAELWTKFKTDYEKKFNVSIAVADNGTVRAPTSFLYYGYNSKNKDVRNLLNDANYSWAWLKTYLTNASGSFDLNTEVRWRWTLAAFFEDGLGAAGDYNANITNAKKPERWKPAYLESTIHDEPIDIEAEWRVSLNAFFMQKQIKTYPGGYITADFAVHGQPNAWKNAWWSANLLSTPTAVKNRNYLPELIRDGYIFGGWYFGNDHNSNNRGYNITAPVTVDSIAYGCIYARWLEPVLREGHVTDEQMRADQRKIYTNFNLDLIKVVANQAYDLQLDRKIVGGMYNTMCLPFDIEGKTEFAKIQYDNDSGPFTSVDDFSLVKYTGTRVTDEAIVLTFQELGNDEKLPANTLPANTPFLLKPNKDITKLMQYGTAKKVEVVDHTPVQAVEDDGEGDNGEGDDGGGAIIPQTPAEYALTVQDANGGISFTGVLAPVSVPDNSVLLVANNRLAVSTGGEMKGMRGFFSPLELPIQQPMAIQITTKDGATTYLDAVNMTTETKAATKILYNGQIYILRGDEVYTITGAKVK